MYVALLIVFAAVVTYIFLDQRRAKSAEISGTVTSVQSRPNIAEDGYYAVQVTDAEGVTYTVNATGYMNTPLTPDDNDQTCVEVPRDVEQGDRVTFRLPEQEDGRQIYEICHPSSHFGYYFRVE